MRTPPLVAGVVFRVPGVWGHYSVQIFTELSSHNGKMVLTETTCIRYLRYIRTSEILVNWKMQLDSCCSKSVNFAVNTLEKENWSVKDRSLP